MREYNHLILGGTFDHFHKGHELFVETALKQGKRVTIGLTTEKLYQHKLLWQFIQMYELRSKNMADFILTRQKNLDNIRVIPLTTIYGNGLTDKTVDGIVVTEDTKKGGEMINKKRKEAGMKALDIIVVPMVKGDDDRVISSERIRYGDIDKQGKNYYKWLADKAPLYLPISLRSRLREPLGDLIKGTYEQKHQVVKKIITTIKKVKPAMVFAIGDIVVESLREVGYIPSVEVVDFRSRRQALPEVKSLKLKVKSYKEYRNAAGTIENLAVHELQLLRNKYMKGQTHQSLVIVGEEDLLALPAILLAPLGSIVLYGQYNLGVISVKVTEEKKNEVMDLLRQFNINE